MSDWSMALDNLASAGIIDYDAPAFILGQKPRYVGHPRMEELPTIMPEFLPPGVKMKDIPQIDSYDNSKSQNIVKPSRWKKWLFGGLVVGGLALFGLSKTGHLGKITQSVKNIIPKNVKTSLKSGYSSVCQFFNNINSKFKKP